MRMTQIEIAKKTGLAQSFISSILRGVRRASPKAAARLEEATGVHRLFWMYPGEYREDGSPAISKPHPTTPTPRTARDGE
ncbi:helix-turn-helix domain-containing protein [Oleidesulfovibrio sp.]|uniref:helix-turn-helix domain-containing protein n=1 Tax=Oleidesulfovibrio sp. TaxID=2909707 RepID=UPI003A873319